MDPNPPSTHVPTEPASDWHPEDACRQVKLVDLLQFISEITPKQLRVAVMISAWDLVENAHNLTPGAAAAMPNDPDRFIACRWPLLHQFLLSNGQAFQSRVYGVSARGGGNSKQEIARLTNFDRPNERVILVDGTHRSHDLTRPVRWLIGLTDCTTNG